MELIDRYVRAAARRLPAKVRRRAEEELRSQIALALKARVQTREPAEDDVVAVLLEMGPPEAAAARYLPASPPLIGPELRPAFRSLVGTALLVVAFVTVSGHLIRHAASPGPASGLLFDLIGDLVPGAASAIGAVTLTLALLERILTGKTAAGSGGARWDPRRLPQAAHDESAVNASEQASELFFAAAALVVFNFLPDRIGIDYRSETGWAFAPLFTADPEIPMLAWNAVLIASLALQLYLLFRRTWTPALRAAQMAVAAAMAVLLLDLAGETWVTPETVPGFGPEANAALLNLLCAAVNWGVRTALVVPAAMYAVSIWNHGAKIARAGAASSKAAG